MAKFSEISPFADVTLTCTCGKFYSGWKNGSHEFIKMHKDCEGKIACKVIHVTLLPNEDDLVSGFSQD
jgi:hypothetical protein